MFMRNVKPAGYELDNGGKRMQPLLIDAEYLQANPKLSVELDGKIILMKFWKRGITYSKPQCLR